MNLATNAYLQHTYGSRSSLKLTGVKGFPMRGTPLTLDFASLLGPVFFMCVSRGENVWEGRERSMHGLIDTNH